MTITMASPPSDNASAVASASSAGCPFSADELATCGRVLATVAHMPELFEIPWARPLRQSLGKLVQRMYERRNDTESNDNAARGTLGKRAMAAIKDEITNKIRRLDRDKLDKCRLRAERMARLSSLVEIHEGPTIPRIPDGPAGDVTVEMPLPALPLQPFVVTGEANAESPGSVQFPIKCYICKGPFTVLHRFYHNLCAACGDFNFGKRQQTADLHGKIALVTGARVKVGYFSVLKLLQAGATVIATSRFPVDTVERYRRHPQFESFADRLHIYAVDLRDLVHLHAFLDFVMSKYDRLDIVINNACQTVRRPPQFYRHLIQKEMQSYTNPKQLQQTLQHNTEFHSIQCKKSIVSEHTVVDENGPPSTLSTSGFSIPVALKSQIPLLPQDFENDDKSFPANALDVHDQQVDLREKNSWILRLGEIETPEIAEVFTINAMAPLVINNRLLEMLRRRDHPDEAKFIVNVSAMEGKFYRHKKATHPHTNMAKAALNMMTRTSGPELARQHIYMTSVDTGWINDENPLHIAREAAEKYDFQTPLDEIDAASRVLDPIFDVFNGAEPQFGCFLKDYKETEW